MTDNDFLNLRPGDIVSHNLTPWLQYIVVCKHLFSHSFAYNVCEMSYGDPKMHSMRTPDEWSLISSVVTRQNFAPVKVLEDCDGSITDQYSSPATI